MDSNHEELIAHFSGVTGASPSTVCPQLPHTAASSSLINHSSQAQTALAASDWNLEQAVALYFASQDAPDNDSEDNDDDETLHSSSSLPPTQAAPPTSRPSRPPPQQSRMRTFRDLQNEAEREEGGDSDDDPNQDFFAGGEKSGLAVQNPNNRPQDHFRNIMQQARE